MTTPMLYLKQRNIYEWKTTSMENNTNGRQTQWKTISMKDGLNGTQPQWKTTSMEDDLNGGRFQC